MNAQQILSILRQFFGEVQFSSGQDLLDARALWAGIVGPHRLAMGQGRSVSLSADSPTELAKNIGAANAYVMVGVALPAGAPPPVTSMGVVMSGQSSIGVNAQAPFTLTPAMGGAPYAPTGFTQLLLPGEQLFGQIFDAAFPTGTSQRVVVTTVQF